MTGERGSIAPLLAGLLVVVLALVLGGVDITTAQLARLRLYDAADSISLQAADAVDTAAYFATGVSDTVVLTDRSVRAAAEEDLAARARPAHVTRWALMSGTGSPDGRTAVVRLAGTVEVPFTSWVLGLFGGSVTITVESRARSGLT